MPSTAEEVSDPDVQIDKKRTLKFLEDRLEVVTRKVLVPKERKQQFPWQTIEKVSVNWHCFSGMLAVKLKNGEQHHFKMRKAKLMQSASAIHRRIGRSKSTTPLKPIDEKVRKLLQDHGSVGVGSNGLLVKKDIGCCNAGIFVSPWTSFVSLRLSRGCHSGVIEVHTVLKSSLEKKARASWSKRGGFKHGGDNLLSDSDEDDVEIYADTSQHVFTIKAGAGASEQLYTALKTKMTDNFEDLEELPGVYPIKSRNVMGKLTRAGIDAAMFGVCSKEAKMFTPWESVISVAFKHPTCFKRSCIVIEDRTAKSILLKDVPLQSFLDIKNAFSEKSMEDTKLRSSQNSTASLEPSAMKGLEIKDDGVHYNKPRCCMRQISTFIPWSKLDGLTMLGSTLGRTTIEVVTETGNHFRVAKTTKKKAWDEFQKLHTIKYGVGSSAEVQLFNEVKDPRYNCKLSDQSLFLSLNKGMTVFELDLDRVAGARRCKDTHTQLEVGVSMGKLSGIMTVQLLEGNKTARELAREICKKAQKRKEKLLKAAA